MKTLVITGAARKNGHTNQMVKLFLDTLGGEYTIIDAYRAENIAPCKDCRYCWHKKGCSIHDGMDEVYRLLEEADNVVLASPMYFHSITGKMKASSTASRCTGRAMSATICPRSPCARAPSSWWAARPASPTSFWAANWC
mgnify:CR=1 FL=1